MTDYADTSTLRLREHAGRETAYCNWFREPRLSYCWWTMGQPSAAYAARTLDHEDDVHVRDAPLVPHERSDSNISGTWATGADEAYLSERTILTRGPAGSCAISITGDVAVAKKDGSH